MLNTVTGAFGYTGKYITRKLLELGEQVQTITGHPNRPDPFGGKVKAYSFNFNDPESLAKSLKGTSTLYNTYWVRFPYKDTTYEQAIQNTLALFKAAKKADVNRVVHLSITNADLNSPLPYFRGKAIIEKALMESSLSYAIIRPTVIFGKEDILINNIAWFLRKFPVFVIPGEGQYKLQPIYVEDLAELAVRVGHEQRNIIVDAAGPETFTYEELVRIIARSVGSSARYVHVSPTVALVVTKCLNLLVRDVVLTRDEIQGLMAGLLVSSGPAKGKTRLSEWLKENRETIGLKYASEVACHYQ